MIKRVFVTVVVASLGLFLAGTTLGAARVPGAAAPQAGAQDTPPAEMMVLARLDALEAEVGTLREQLEEANHQLLDATARLDRQAQAGKKMLGALDRAVAAGYTAGINFESRQILVAAWRNFYAALEPVRPAADADARNERKRRVIDGPRR